MKGGLSRHNIGIIIDSNSDYDTDLDETEDDDPTGQSIIPPQGANKQGQQAERSAHDHDTDDRTKVDDITPSPLASKGKRQTGQAGVSISSLATHLAKDNVAPNINKD